MPRKNWLPDAMPHLAVLMQNFQAKIGTYATELGLSPARVAEAEAICGAFIGAFNTTEQCRATMIAMTQWRDRVFYGTNIGSPAPAAPVFPVVGPVTYNQGVVKQFMRLREQIVASPGYTAAIGEDLGIIGPETSRPAPASIVPDLKLATSTEYWVNLTGSMQGMDALRVEYSRDGENFQTVSFLTSTPAGFQISPANPGQPEKGVIRAIYMKKNHDAGRYSANYPVLLS